MSQHGAVGGQEARTLRRSPDGILGGVASGVAEYVGVDPVVVRLVLAGLTLAGGSGLVAYGLLWACLPAPGSDRSPLEALLASTGAAPAWIRGYLAIVVGLLVLDGLVTDGSGLVIGVGLIVLGVALFRRDATATTAGTATPATPLAPAAPGERTRWPAPEPGTWGEPGATGTGREPGGGASGAGWPAVVRPGGGVGVRARRGASWLGRATAGFVVLALGAAMLADLAGLVALDATRALAVALSVVGIGLVIGTWWGRSRGLLALGLVLLTALTGLALAEAVGEAGVGGRVDRPATLGDVRGDYDLLAGLSVVDLSDVDFTQTPTQVTARVGVGRLEVIVPAGVTVEVAGHVRAGDLKVAGEYQAGTDVEVDALGEGEPGGGRLALDVGVTVGSVVVRRADGEGTLP